MAGESSALCGHHDPESEEKEIRDEGDEALRFIYTYAKKYKLVLPELDFDMSQWEYPAFVTRNHYPLIATMPLPRVVHCLECLLVTLSLSCTGQ